METESHGPGEKEKKRFEKKKKKIRRLSPPALAVRPGGFGVGSLGPAGGSGDTQGVVGMPSASGTVRVLGCAGSAVHCLAPKAPAQPYSQPPDVRPPPDQSAPRRASSHRAPPS